MAPPGKSGVKLTNSTSISGTKPNENVSNLVSTMDFLELDSNPVPQQTQKVEVKPQ
jgi:hypothetical protein